MRNNYIIRLLQLTMLHTSMTPDVLRTPISIFLFSQWGFKLKRTHLSLNIERLKEMLDRINLSIFSSRSFTLLTNHQYNDFIIVLSSDRLFDRLLYVLSRILHPY